MAGGIVYLDVDDEITSAASRIREAEGRRVVLVLPYGSRVATSRINFRLLSRDALLNEKQLAVVAGDPATRALAASAGLPVFPSVSEYEASVAGPGGEPGERPAAPPPGFADATVAETASGGAATPTKGARRRKATGPATTGGDAAPAMASDVPTTTGAGAMGSASAAGAAVKEPGAASGTTGSGAPRRPATPPGDPGEAIASVDDATIRFEPLPPQPTGGVPGWGEPRPRPATRAGSLAATRPGARRGSRLPLVIVLAALAMVVLVGGVGAYVLLPSATIVVTPRVEDLALPALTVAADPTATEPDAASRVIPAELVTNDVVISDSFPATGKRVEETAAEGVVRFSNLDFLRSNTIDGGSIVSTNSGVRFRTAKTVTVPRADLVGLTVFPGRINVTVTAVEPGTSGNVEPNTIVIVPRGEDPQALKVVNPDASAGGTHEEFPEVLQGDVDVALEALTARISADTSTIAVAQAANPDRTVFEETLTIGEPTPTVDPATFVGEEIETFELGLSATATVLAVDPAPVAAIADSLVRDMVKPGYALVEGSIVVSPGEGVVAGQSVTFPVSATAQEVVVLDADDLRQLVLGKPLDEAEALLAPFGRVEVTAWPDWVSAVPTFPDRVDVRIDDGVVIESPGASGSSS